MPRWEAREVTEPKSSRGHVLRNYAAMEQLIRKIIKLGSEIQQGSCTSCLIVISKTDRSCKYFPPQIRQQAFRVTAELSCEIKLHATCTHGH